MPFITLLADSCNRNLELLKHLIGDFTDADMLVRPCPGANHAAWQVGHLICGENKMISMAAPGAMPELPAGFADHFNKQTASSDDPAAFPGKSQLLDLLVRNRAATVAWVRSLDEQDLQKPGPAPLAAFAPTIGHLVLMIPSHLLMHLGQIQVIRRRLGKPVLF